MKWITATNESSLRVPEFYEMLRLAVYSLRQHTSLSPYLIVDGRDCKLLDWFRINGVTILFEDLELRDPLKEFYAREKPDTPYNTRAGAFLKTQIPSLAKKHGWDDDFVLYTDCDVLFLREMNLEAFKPRWLAMSASRRFGGFTRYHLGGLRQYNSGVIIMNVDKMAREANHFNEFVITNGKGIKRPRNFPFMQKNLFLSDQVALNLFYRKRITPLPRTYNWNPQSGFNQDINILHFNGLKWTDWERFKRGDFKDFQMQTFTKQVELSNGAYEHYICYAKRLHETMLKS